MIDINFAARCIERFLYEFRFGNWMGCNPQYKQLSASSRVGLLALIRIAVPACGKARDARLAEAIRLSGYDVFEDAAGFYIERQTTPAVAVAN